MAMLVVSVAKAGGGMAELATQLVYNDNSEITRTKPARSGSA